MSFQSIRYRFPLSSTVCGALAIVLSMPWVAQLQLTAHGQETAQPNQPVAKSVKAGLTSPKHGQDAVLPTAPFRLPPPSSEDRTIAKAIATLMPRFHVSAKGLGDDVSKRALDLYTESLDPLKLYFYQSDIDEFAKYAYSIDDMVLRGDLTVAVSIFNRFIARVDARVQTAVELLDGEFDFTLDESIVRDPEDKTFANSPEEAKDRWRRQIKYSLLVLKDEGKTVQEGIETLRGRYARYARRWRQTDTQDIVERFMTAVTSSYDPHSTYMSPDTFNDFQISLSLNLDGIGAQLREKDGNTVITRVIPGGAADMHGKLQTDDVIVSVGQGRINGEPTADMVDIVEMPLGEVVKKIRGRAGTVVRLGVKKGGVGDVIVYEIVRARIELDESAARGEVIEHTLPGETGKLKIGYINLPSFYLDMEGARQATNDFRSSTRDVRRIIEGFKTDGVDGIVLDLSRNGGGSLTEAINLTGLFIDRGPVVQVKNSDGSVQQYDDTRGGTLWDGPLVVMTSKFSASASEILAGAIKDYRRGIVVGDPQTHGKGTVQTLMNLAEVLFRNKRQQYGALKVTLQQFYLPDGQSTQLQGVAADIVLPSLTAKMDIAEGDLKYALKQDRVRQARHILYNMLPQDLLMSIQKRSMDRISANSEFNDLQRRVKLYVEQKKENKVSLDEKEFFARRKELDAEKEEEEKVLEAELGDEVIFQDNFYNREVMNIAFDYITGLRKQNLAQAR